MHAVIIAVIAAALISLFATAGPLVTELLMPYGS